MQSFFSKSQCKKQIALLLLNTLFNYFCVNKEMHGIEILIPLIFPRIFYSRFFSKLFS